MKLSKFTFTSRSSIALHAVLLVSLALFFGVLFFDDHSYGAYGDDSPGYIYLASRIVAGDPVVYSDTITTEAIDFFGDEKLARWLTPTHHDFISPDGMMASRYPLGMAIVLALGAWATGSLAGMYVVVPLLAMGVVILTYVLAISVFREHAWRHLIGAASASALGLLSLFSAYASAQPMREIPSVFFFMLGVCALYWAIEQFRSKHVNSWMWLLFVVAGVGIGFAVNIRETTVTMIPAAFVYAIARGWNTRAGVEHNVKKLAWPFVTVLIATVIALVPTIYNAIQIQNNRVQFKVRDTAAVAVLPNIDHLQTISIKNVFENSGRYRPANGSLDQYIDIMNTSTPLPYTLALVVLGFVLLWKTDRSAAALFGLWILGVLTIFSLWVNPYSRYIIPLFPPLFIIAAYGGVELVRNLGELFSNRYVRTVVGVVMVAAVIVAYVPVIQKEFALLHEQNLEHKAISYLDYSEMMSITDTVPNSPESVVIFSGEFQYGMSEMLYSHTDIRGVRFPFEQKFDYDEQQVYDYIEKLQKKGYELYMWADKTSSPEAYQFLQRYNAQQIDTLNFSFQNNVALYQL